MVLHYNGDKAQSMEVGSGLLGADTTVPFIIPDPCFGSLFTVD